MRRPAALALAVALSVPAVVFLGSSAQAATGATADGVYGPETRDHMRFFHFDTAASCRKI